MEKKSLEEEPMEIFKDCNEYLYAEIENPKSLPIITLFCVAYIKAYCYTFIKKHDDKGFSPKKIIETIDNDVKLKIIKIYIYKIIYNLNNKQIDIFLNKEGKKKYYLQLYSNQFIKFKNEEQINYTIETLDNENYQKVYDILKNEGEFEKKIKDEFYDDEEDKLKFDNFYIAAYNLILSKLSNLKIKNFDTSAIYENFFKNVCEPLFGNNEDKDKMDDKNNKLFSLIQFLFNPKKYSKIKEKYEINSMNIESLLYGYRYCLNEIAEEHPRGEYIFSTLYIKGKTDYLKKKFYPGSDTKDESYYELYNKIENHFRKNPNEGCYICLCDNNKGYYHTIPSGFPGYDEKGLTCPYCGNFIGTKKEIYIQDKDDKENKLCLVCEPVK